MKTKLLFIVASVVVSVSLPSHCHCQWVENGVLVSWGGMDQRYPVIVQDGEGGSIIAWHDDRDLHWDIYAQRLDADGVPLWTDNGIPVCTASFEKQYLQAIPDGYGGAIVSWCNLVPLPLNPQVKWSDIYAQRIDAEGNILWNPGGVPVCTADYEQSPPLLVTDGAGGAILAWADMRNYVHHDIYTQRINADGSVAWAENGIPVCDISSNQWRPEIAVDGCGGAIIAWRDERTSTAEIYAQRIGGNGSPRWTYMGVPVSILDHNKDLPGIIPDGRGGAIITWMGNGLYAQRLDSIGCGLWGDEGVNLFPQTVQSVQAIPDDEGGAFIAMSQITYCGDYYDCSYAWMQRIDSNGNLLWGLDGIEVGQYLVEERWNPQAVLDGSGGVIVTWSDGNYEYGSSNCDIYAQRLDEDGNFLWPAGGAAVCTAGNAQWLPRLIGDSAGGAIITWMDKRSASWDIYATRINGAGEITATLLRSHHAIVEGSSITVSWTLSIPGLEMRFFIFRANARESSFEPFEGPKVERSGMTFTFRDESCVPGETYVYRVEISDEDGRRILFETDRLTARFQPLALFQNYPNPFNPSTTIKYYLPEAGRVTLEVFDIAGCRIVCLSSEEKKAGMHSIVWDGRDSEGRRVSAGTYIYRLRSGKETISRKMILIK